MIATLQKIPKTASMREVQRNYRSLFDWVNKTKKPLVLTSGSTPSVVVLNLNMYHRLLQKRVKDEHIEADRRSQDIERRIKILRSKKGKQNISLSEFVIQDRERH